MPPKAKFTKEEIVEAALGIAHESGFDALTARTLGERLGSSARPIFTVFKSMDEVRRGNGSGKETLCRIYWSWFI